MKPAIVSFLCLLALGVASGEVCEASLETCVCSDFVKKSEYDELKVKFDKVYEEYCKDQGIKNGPELQELGYTKLSNGLWYRTIYTYAGYEDAKQVCEGDGARLASTGIRDNKIVGEIFSELVSLNGEYTVDLYDKTGQFEWEWGDGVSDFGDATWLENEPNSPGSERCVQVMVRNGATKLNNIPCGDTHAYFCEADTCQ